MTASHISSVVRRPHTLVLLLLIILYYAEGEPVHEIYNMFSLSL